MLRNVIGPAILLLCLSACAGVLRQEAPDRRHFALEASRTGPFLMQPHFDGGLAVNRFGIAQAFGRRNLVYRMSETEFESDYYNLFLVDPGELITQETRKWLLQANLFDAVPPPGSRLRPAYTLDGQVLEMYGDLSRGPVAAVLSLQFFMTHEPLGPTEVLLQKRYQRRVPLDERSPAGLVRAYNDGLSSILQELERDLLELSSERAG
jgi:cholesterol transport system auxiliary component